MAEHNAYLPSLQDALSSSSAQDAPLGVVLSLLFEPSPVLLDTLVPQLSASLQKDASGIRSYSLLIDAALAEIGKWDDQLRAQFIAGHPRIGEIKNLSKLSAKEQGTGSTSASAPVTPPEVLTRLAHLNICYERTYPGLRYITFVDGRSRAVIAEEMENVLGIDHSLAPDDPPVSTLHLVESHSNQWKAELDRAVYDVGRIAKSRLKVFGVE